MQNGAANAGPAGAAPFPASTRSDVEQPLLPPAARNASYSTKSFVQVPKFLQRESSLRLKLIRPGEGDPHALPTEQDKQRFSSRAPWLRAFVLGANDGLVSVASTVLGVGAGTDELSIMRLAGVAAWIAGALSMAAGEYISVASQKDSELADIEKEKEAQALGPASRAEELEILARVYEERGLTPELAQQVAEQLSANDVIRAHARDELGIDLDALANPLQASVVSAIAFTMGAAIPLLSGGFIADPEIRTAAIVGASTVGLAAFGIAAAVLGGANKAFGALRVVVGGLIAMGATYGVGHALGADGAAR